MSNNTWVKQLFREKIALFCVLPMLIIYMIFRIWPVFEALRLSLIKLELFGPSEFVGLSNYMRLLQDKRFYDAMGRTLIYTGLSTALLIPISLIVASAINLGGLKGKTIFKVIYFLPIITATPVIGFVWRSMFDPMFGPVTHFLQLIGLP